jgi:hypothetical protein
MRLLKAYQAAEFTVTVSEASLVSQWSMKSAKQVLTNLDEEHEDPCR